MDQDDDASTRDEPVGSVATEAVRLLGALADWAKDATPDLEAHLATGAAECTYCPICRTVHLARELRPEVKEQLVTAASSALQSLSGLLAAAAPEGRDTRGGVEHIDLDDTGEWPDEPDVQPDEETDPEEGDR